MKINSGNQPQQINPRPSLNPTSRNVQRQGSGPEQEDAAKVSVSSKAEEMAVIRGKLDQSPEVRMEKVAQIKAEIEAGTYERPAADIAEKMIQQSLFDSLFAS